MLNDTNDFPLPLPQRALRSAMFRSGLTARLGRRYWRPTAEAPYIHVVHERPVEMFAGMPTDFADPVYGATIGPESARWSRYRETITAIDDCWVDPGRCLIIGPDGRLVEQSQTQRLLPLYPSILGYRRRHARRRLPEAVVYDGFASSNYYHHLIDCLPGIPLLLERSGLAADIPLIVNRWIYESRFFAHLRRRSALFAGLNWHIVEPGKWLPVERAYRLHAAPFEGNAFDFIRAMYGRIAEPAGRRIFLSRDSAMFGRGISNEREVASLLGAHGFETVYAEHLTVEEQQRCFAEATHVVALQGMGLVQQMFMEPGSGHVLELMPSDRLQSEYYWQGWTLGMRFYDVQTGSALDGSGKYRVDLARLEAGVERMLAHPAGYRRYGEMLLPG